MLSGWQTENQRGGIMAKSNRSPLQVSPEFKKKLDDIQKEIMMAKGERRSLREITDDIVGSPMFGAIEQSLIKKSNTNVKRIDFRIKMDRRMFE